jgi:hypothetical protein
MCPTHLSLLYVSILITLGEEYKSCSTSLYSYLNLPITSYLFGPNILLSTLFSKTFSLLSSPKARDQVSHPYRTTGKIIVFYMLLFTFLESRQDIEFWTEWQHALIELILLLILKQIQKQGLHKIENTFKKKNMYPTSVKSFLLLTPKNSVPNRTGL